MHLQHQRAKGADEHLGRRFLVAALMLHRNCIVGRQHAGAHLLSIPGFSSHMGLAVLLVLLLAGSGVALRLLSKQ